MPRARLMLNEPAARAAPVPPAQTSACARPSATARAAWTIDASGVVRAAFTGSSALAIDTGASTTSTPVGSSPSSAAGPNRSTRSPLFPYPTLRRPHLPARGQLPQLGRGAEQERARALPRRDRGAGRHLGRTE